MTRKYPITKNYLKNFHNLYTFYKKELTLKSSIVTANESRTPASIVSSSKSIRSILPRICWRAASEQREAKSAPTWP